MEYRNILIVLLALVLIGGIYLATESGPTQNVKRQNKKEVSSTPEHARYLIDDHYYRLFDGTYVRSVDQGAKEVQRLEMHEELAFGDIDGDGDEDAFVILRQETSSGEILYRAAFAVYNDMRGEFKGTNAVLLGKRIAVEEMFVEDGTAHIRYRAETADQSATSGEARAEQIKRYSFDREQEAIVEVE